MLITTQEATNLLQEHKEIGKGTIFTVVFRKRTTGEIRTMNCRFDVKSHLKGGILRYVPSEKNLMTVFDLQKSSYRSINLEDIISLKIGGLTYQVKEPQVR